MFSLEQYAAAHTSAVIGGDGWWGTVAMTGADRGSFLHGLLTNDIAALTTGRGAYAAYLTPQGRMISDMRVVETGDRMLLGVSRSGAAPLADRLNALVFSEDAQATDVTAELDDIGVHGPTAASIIEHATGISVARLSSQYTSLSHAWNRSAEPLTIVRDDAFGVPGFSVYVPHRDHMTLRQMLANSGAVNADDDTLESLRIEAGRPRFGTDMNIDTIPLEAGIEDRAISFTKGCYVGQEVIIRVMHRGHGRVARRLVRLVVSGSDVPGRGATIFAGEAAVGEITSAAHSPKAGAPLAFGYVHRDHTSPGTELRVDGSKAVVYQPRD
jgi:folate-binding protein YgfZ